MHEPSVLLQCGTPQQPPAPGPSPPECPGFDFASGLPLLHKLAPRRP